MPPEAGNRLAAGGRHRPQHDDAGVERDPRRALADEERHLCVPALDCQRGAVDELVLAECLDDRLVGKAQVQSPSPSLQRFTGSAGVTQGRERLLRRARVERGLDLLVGVGGTAADASAADVDVEDLAGTVDPHSPDQRLALLAGVTGLPLPRSVTAGAAVTWRQEGRW